MPDAVAPEEIARWHRWFAIECNNRAWRLAEQASRTGAENEEMLHAAHAAALHWAKVGTPLHHNRATMLLAHVHALFGDGARALGYARAALDYAMSHESPDWEIAFAHAVLANAAAASGAPALHAEEYAKAQALGAALLEAQERSIFEATLRVVPIPAQQRSPR